METPMPPSTTTSIIRPRLPSILWPSRRIGGRRTLRRQRPLRSSIYLQGPFRFRLQQPSTTVTASVVLTTTSRSKYQTNLLSITASAIMHYSVALLGMAA